MPKFTDIYKVMAKYSKSSSDKLAQVHPDLRTIFYKVLALGYDHLIADSYRTKAKQHEYFTSIPQLSKVDYPTVHNTRPSMAVDVYVYEHDKGADYDEKQSADFAGFVKGVALMLLEDGEITHKIRCGNDWNRNSDVNDQLFNDPGHFEIVPNPEDTFQYFET
jgi:peptidoglycan L-alanyl-D-glutamate endopeptidase CwlK